ncbi:MAG: DUF1572 family protein [Bacteroidetes bacterium]|jgi:hypothetical protein|nr:DUF1572 family protein [Bacteroidota bacterium]MDF1866376.1 DUF1572 family protein [Saprospiraceae bacterium]
MNDNFIHFYQKHLNQLKEEIEMYPNEESIWKVVPGITNSAGVLACHLIGNLNHFVGHVLGDTGYVRDRSLEFSIRDLPRDEIIKRITDTSEMLESVIKKIPDLKESYPSGYWSWESDIHYALLQLLWHLTYHLGQINYHRRILTRV